MISIFNEIITNVKTKIMRTEVLNVKYKGKYEQFKTTWKEEEKDLPAANIHAGHVSTKYTKITLVKVIKNGEEMPMEKIGENFQDILVCAAYRKRKQLNKLKV
jgi:hypothetical protein